MKRRNIDQHLSIAIDNVRFFVYILSFIPYLNTFDITSVFNKNIDSSTNEYFKLFDDTYNEFNPELLVKYKFLKSKIKDQKDENANLLKQIDLLNQDIKLIFDNIVKLGTRLENVEKVGGINKYDHDEELEDSF